MTATGTGRATPGDRSWSDALLAATEPSRRNRRTIDAFFLLWAAIVAGLTAVIAESAPHHDEDVAGALTTVFGWAEPLWRIVFVALFLLALAVVVGVRPRRHGLDPRADRRS
jgi:hypothetical protein